MLALFLIVLIMIFTRMAHSELIPVTKFQTSLISKSKDRFLTDPSSKVTAVFITCCQRQNLLKDSLMNFSLNNDYPIRQIIVAHDGPITKNIIQVLTVVPPLTFLAINQKVGQILTIDKAYQLVKTPYVYFSEDDMALTMKGVIKMNVQILQEDPKVLQVRNNRAFNQQYPKIGKYIDPQKYLYSGFSFHPSVNRMSVYLQLPSGYAGLTGNCSYGTGAGQSEQYINDYYRQKWFCVQAQLQSVLHIGDSLGNPRNFDPYIVCLLKKLLKPLIYVLIFGVGAILGVLAVRAFRSKKIQKMQNKGDSIVGGVQYVQAQQSKQQKQQPQLQTMNSL